MEIFRKIVLISLAVLFFLFVALTVTEKSVLFLVLAVFCHFTFHIFLGDYFSTWKDPSFLCSKDLNKSAELTAGLIKTANSEICISSGHLDSQFWDNSLIVSSLNGVLQQNSNVKIKIFVEKITQRTSQFILEKCKEKLIDVYEVGKRLSSHFVIIDGKHIRKESKYFNYAHLEKPTFLSRLMRCIILLSGRGNFKLSPEINFIKIDSKYLAKWNKKYFNKISKNIKQYKKKEKDS